MVGTYLSRCSISIFNDHHSLLSSTEFHFTEIKHFQEFQLCKFSLAIETKKVPEITNGEISNWIKIADEKREEHFPKWNVAKILFQREAVFVFHFFSFSFSNALISNSLYDEVTHILISNESLILSQLTQGCRDTQDTFQSMKFLL